VNILRTFLWSTALLLIFDQALGGDKQVEIAGPLATVAFPGWHFMFCGCTWLEMAA
jgi:hypothetical protein